MHAIYASKLYRASKHKDKIKAALANPLNSELVIQLKEYLDEDDLNQIQDKIDEESPSEAADFTEEEIDEETPEAEEKIRPSQHSSSSAHSAPKADHHLSEKVAEFEENRDAELAGEEKKTFEVQKPSESNNEVEETTTISKTSIKANTCFSSSGADDLMGALNAREDTAGVCRVIQKDSATGSELWVHYNDSTNLNNVMEPAISLLNASNYSYLDFNRLARTENAIVFTISSTPKPVEPVQEAADE